MRKIFAALIFLCAIAPAHAQFAEAMPKTYPQAVGGPVGSQTFVLAPPKSTGLITIGKPFGDFLEPYIDALVQAILAALVGWVCMRIQKRTGIEIDEKHRDALVQALSNQAGSLIADGMVKLEGEKITVPSETLAKAANEVMDLMPDAARHFGITPDYVAARIIDTIPQIPAGVQMLAKKAEGKLP